jgi:peptidoglycan hydrolase CwlO-like protein
MEPEAKPWWHQTRAVAGVTTLALTVLGFVVTAATAATNYFEKTRELELEHEKHLNDLRLAYLDRLGAPLLRQQTLEFMEIDDNDERLRAWATAELKKIAPEVEKLQQKLAKSEGDLSEALARIDKLDTQLHDTLTQGRELDKQEHVAPADRERSKGESSQIKEELQHARADLEQKQAAVEQRRAALGAGFVANEPLVSRRRPLLDRAYTQAQQQAE